MLPPKVQASTRISILSFMKSNNGRAVRTKEHAFECLRPNFGWTTTNHFKKTLENTTQFARAQDCYPMRKHYKTHFPAVNINWLNETVAMDTFFSDVPAHDDGIRGHGGATMVQFYQLISLIQLCLGLFFLLVTMEFLLGDNLPALSLYSTLGWQSDLP
jgi:hypothetical protein